MNRTELSTRTNDSLADILERVLPAVYLVRRGDESAFTRTALVFSQRLAGIHLELKVDGPPPAYHFVEAGGCRD